MLSQFSHELAMKLLSSSGLLLALTAAGLLALPLPSQAAGCPFSSLDTPKVTTSGQSGDGGLMVSSPDRSALGIALGGLGAIAALLAGGTVLVRQRQLAQVDAANAAALAAEADLTLATETELVLTPQSSDVEADLAVAPRR